MSGASAEFSKAIIIGSGFEEKVLESGTVEAVETVWGDRPNHIIRSSSPDLCYLARHGLDHIDLPHQINYQANIAALHKLGVRHIISINIVGAVNPQLQAGQWVLVDQLIDYTWGRESSFYSDPEKLSAFNQDMLDRHIDFTAPMSLSLQQKLKAALQNQTNPWSDEAVYGVTQGPRLETAAEIKRLASDGVDIVGMTAMPEAALARELDIDYAALSLVVNMAAGVGDEENITIDDIRRILADHVESGLLLAQQALSS